MKRIRLLIPILAALLLFTACGAAETDTQGISVVATTYPMYYMTRCITENVPDITVEAMVSEPVSCLHDYTLGTSQMKLLSTADAVVLSGAGLENFMGSALEQIPAEAVVDSSAGIDLLDGDPHIWLDPERYARQGENIAAFLSEKYPEYAETFTQNAETVTQKLLQAKEAWRAQLADLKCRELITFHDGFTYFADAFDLTILAAIEEEEGAEPSAAELAEICKLVSDHELPVIFAEVNGSDAAAKIVSGETGVPIGCLTMIMSPRGEDYFEDMDENISALKAGLG